MWQLGCHTRALCQGSEVGPSARRGQAREDRTVAGRERCRARAHQDAARRCGGRPPQEHSRRVYWSLQAGCPSVSQPHNRHRHRSHHESGRQHGRLCVLPCSGHGVPGELPISAGGGPPRLPGGRQPVHHPGPEGAVPQDAQLHDIVRLSHHVDTVPGSLPGAHVNDVSRQRASLLQHHLAHGVVHIGRNCAAEDILSAAKGL
mmetsp:Transcript_20428/g.51442  ORF Transcript_20428/g.51442 Transcript_20428/m.51442 type:complete len:203 (+) Transcript_20428:119-727(+)